MKKILIVLLFSLCSGVSFGQILATADSPEYRNLMKMSVALFTRSTFQLGFERFTTPTSSVFVAAGFSFIDSDYQKNWGIRTEAQMRFHVFTVIKPRNSHRLYFAPYLMNEYMENQERIYSSSLPGNWKTDTFDAFSGGMLFGWSFSFANRINLDIYSGGGIRKSFGNNNSYNSYDGSVFDYGYSGIVPRLGIDIGFWF